MSIRRRLEGVEDKVINSQKTLCLVGVLGDAESEEQYQNYLRSDIKKPFVWLDIEIERLSDNQGPLTAGFRPKRK